MARVILFHHVQGLTPGVLDLADRLRAGGHAVHTPDLFDGATFATIDEGLAHVAGLGYAEVVERGVAAADALPAATVFMGLSLGVVPAQMLAQTRPDAIGAVLCHACLPASEFAEAWPDDVPLQVHGMQDDPYFVTDGDLEAAREIVASAARAELFLYSGDQHLFSDSSLPAHDAAATDLLVARVAGLLDRI